MQLCLFCTQTHTLCFHPKSKFFLIQLIFLIKIIWHTCYHLRAIPVQYIKPAGQWHCHFNKNPPPKKENRYFHPLLQMEQTTECCVVALTLLLVREGAETPDTRADRKSSELWRDGHGIWQRLFGFGTADRTFKQENPRKCQRGVVLSDHLSSLNQLHTQPKTLKQKEPNE